MSGTTQSDFEATQGGTHTLHHPSLLPIEDPEALRQLYRDHLDHFAPTSPVEVHLLQHFAHTEWSLIRLQAVETAFLNRIYQVQASPFTPQITALDAPTRLGIALESSVNTSRFATFLANRISRLQTDRARLVHTLRSIRKFPASPTTLCHSESPCGGSQVTDSKEAYTQTSVRNELGTNPPAPPSSASPARAEARHKNRRAGRSRTGPTPVSPPRSKPPTPLFDPVPSPPPRLSPPGCQTKPEKPVISRRCQIRRTPSHVFATQTTRICHPAKRP